MGLFVGHLGLPSFHHGYEVPRPVIQLHWKTVAEPLVVHSLGMLWVRGCLDPSRFMIMDNGLIENPLDMSPLSLK